MGRFFFSGNMFVWKWFTNILGALGLWNKKARILFLGLDNAGKTTLLHMLRDDKLVCHVPTRYPQKEELQIGQVTFTAHDLGGHKSARKVWKDYFAAVDGVVYMVDSTDFKRYDESKQELQKLLQKLPPTVPFMILGNKIDLPGAVQEKVLAQALGVDQMQTGKGNTTPSEDIRPLEVFMCTVVKRSGYVPGFKWLAEF